MNEDDCSLSGISESVEYERELVESAYSADNFSADPDDQYKYSLILYPQEKPFFISAQLYFDTRPPYPRESLKCTVKNHTDGLSLKHSMGLSEHQINDVQFKVTKCSAEAQKDRDTAVDKVICLVKDYLNEHNKESSSLHDDMEKANKDQVQSNKEQCSIIPISDDKTFVKTFPPFIQPGDKKQFFKDQLSSSNSYSYHMTCMLECGETGIFNAHDESFKQYLIHEYVLDLSPVKLKNELESIRKDFSRTQKLNPHASLMKYLALDCKIAPVSNVIHVLSPNSWPLSGFAKPYSNVRQLAKELISGLQFIHNQDLLHGLLTVESVFVSPQGRHLIGDYGFAKKLLLDSLKAPFKKFSLKYPDACEEAGKNLDILLFGHVMYHMSVGSETDSAYPSIPSHLDTHLRQFIKAALTQDKQDRPSLTELSNHDFIGETKIHISENVDENKFTFSTEGGTGTMEDFKQDGTEAWNLSKRLTSDYEVKGLLGKGGFGAVIKVRNIFDGSSYAMKVVQLTRSSKNAIEAMREEVKLLSQLKHNHIVRYNSSWVESQSRQVSISSDCSDRRDSKNDATSSEITSIDDDDDENEIENETDNFSDSIEFHNDASFQPSYHDIRSRYQEESSNSSSDVECSMKPIEEETQNSDIVFEHSKKISVMFDAEVSKNSENGSPTRSVIVMFIQMEFCENTTLRTMMDNEQMNPPLHKNLDLILRLLRQIVDALEYIHNMNIMHRDLKPANIFLDSKNEIKIGDFGLAVSGSHGKGSVVGTPFYTAPEVKTRRQYSPLVDIYSLGVICFEMVRGPFETKYERCYVLDELRKPAVNMPQDVFSGSEKLQDVEQLVRKMLNHDVKCRPKANEISLSNILPPRLGQQGLLEIVRHISSEHGSQRKDQFIDSLFSRDITNSHLTHYMQHDKGDTQQQDAKFTKTMNDIIDKMMSAFLKHGAVQCPLPFLLPKCDITDRQQKPFVMLSKLGHYQVLPCNLKLNLAKHVLQNKIKNLKRYGFTQVFRKRIDKNGQPDPNPNPRDILEGSFDMISTNPSVAAQAEVILTVIDVINSITELPKSSCTIYVNHTKIMKAILLFYKIDEIHHNEILKSIYDFSRNYTKLRAALKFECDSLNERQIGSLLTQFKFEGPIDKIHRHADNKDTNFKAILYKSGKKISNLFKEGLREILQIFLLVTSDDLSCTFDIFDPKVKIEDLAEQLTKNFAKDSDVKNMIKIQTGIINDPYCYNDFMFQVVVHRPEVDSKEAVVVAVGGDFQILLKQWKSVNHNGKDDEPLPTAVGVNFLLEDITHILSEKQRQSEKDAAHCSIILISSNSQRDNSVQIFSFMKALWKKGLYAQHVVYDDEIVNRAYHNVIFDDDLITIQSDALYMKIHGRKEEKAQSYYDSKHVIHKFKICKIDDALNFLIGIEEKSEQQKHPINSGTKNKKN